MDRTRFWLPGRSGGGATAPAGQDARYDVVAAGVGAKGSVGANVGGMERTIWNWRSRSPNSWRGADDSGGRRGCQNEGKGSEATIHPRAWAPYFFGRTTPEQAMRLIRQLTRALATESQKEVAAPLETWCAVSCVRSGIVVNLRTRRKNCIAWVSPAGALDRTFWGGAPARCRRT